MSGAIIQQGRLVAFCGRGHVRLENEDAVAIDGVRLPEEAIQDRALEGVSHLAIVADGMGGHALGEIASGLAVTTISEAWTSSPPSFDIIAAVKKANQAIYDAMSGEGRRGMGATIAGLQIEGAVANWFNLGDSRVYLYRAGVLTQLSIDHVPQSDTLPNRGGRSHLITRSLGGGYSFQDVWPATGRQGLEPGDLFLLCSDGLTDVLGDHEIAQAIRGHGSPENAVDALVNDVLSAGAPDNFSIVLQQVGSRFD
jgi:protein phosphatase